VTEQSRWWGRRVGRCVLLGVVSGLMGGCRLTVDLPVVFSGGLFGNVGGWDLSACAGPGLGTCAELFLDNQQRLLGGQTVEQVLYQSTVQLFTSIGKADVRLDLPARR